MTGDDRDGLAAEYAVGLLDGDEHRQAERLLETDASFRAAVAEWQARFSELDETALPAPAAPALWTRIEDEVGRAPAARVAQQASPAPVLVPDPLSAFRALWRNLAFWRVAGLAGSFATLALAVGLGIMAERSARTPVLIAVLLNEANQPTGIINAFSNRQAQLVPFQGMQIPAGRAFEVWAIPGPNQNPISVGLVTEPRSLRLNLERVPSLSANQTFAISVEPPQGSPTGLPTGPVLMKGTTTTAL